MLDLSVRQMQPEIMDDPELDRAEHRRALSDLNRIHRVTNSATQLWKHIRSHINTSGYKSASVLDLGCGDGYMLRKFHELAHREGITLELHGCDFSPAALEFARQTAKENKTPIEFTLYDVANGGELPVKADYVFCSLFLHHFDEQQAVEILRQIDNAATKLALVHDLRRTRLGYVLCWIGVHTLSRSHVVRTDGLLSVRAAFTKAEVEDLVRRAGIGDAFITNLWPERFNLCWSKCERDK